MIEYREHFTFSNELAMFDIEAYTQEHPSSYGNGTLLCFDVLSIPREYGYNHIYDVRYTDVWDNAGMARLARRQIYEDYGVEV